MADRDDVMGNWELVCNGVNAKAPVVADDSITSAVKKLAAQWFFRRVVVFVLIMMATSWS